MPIWSFSKKNKSVNVRSSDGPSRAVGAVAAIGQLSLSSDTTASKYKYGVQTLYDPGSEVAVFE
jgi:hypothetical protein